MLGWRSIRRREGMREAWGEHNFLFSPAGAGMSLASVPHSQASLHRSRFSLPAKVEEPCPVYPADNHEDHADSGWGMTTLPVPLSLGRSPAPHGDTKHSEVLFFRSQEIETPWLFDPLSKVTGLLDSFCLEPRALAMWNSKIETKESK